MTSRLCHMSLFIHHRGDNWQLGVWRMDETSDELRQLLPEALFAEAGQRFSVPHRRWEWLSVRALLHCLLPSAPVVAYHASGRPYLADGSFHISISHTKGYVALILGQTPVGIDIECYGRRVHRVASRFMRADEEVMPWQGDTTWSLLLHWSAKEVLFKCMDTESVDFREHLRIEPFAVREQGSFQAHEYRTAAQGVYQIDYRLHPDFVLTWHVSPLVAE